MRIAFYAPLKPPTHPVPSGDRLMARQLMAAVEAAGHRIELASELRGFTATPDPEALAAYRGAAAEEAHRLAALWRRGGAPDLWLTYHPYYKAPDLLGPGLAREFGLPYVTAECSHSPKRDLQGWADFQAEVSAGIAQAAVNICFTARDREGLIAACPAARTAMLPPFLDPGPFLAPPVPRPGPPQIVTVAMMRPGEKLESFRRLAGALTLLPAGLAWRLAVIGDGPARPEVQAAFAALPEDRLRWLGVLPTEAVARHLSESAIYLWPGVGEAYGLAYLEAQAAGLPVVAEATAGVPDVVRHGETGLLTPEGDTKALAAAVARLLAEPGTRARLGAAARRFVLDERTAAEAARRLGSILGTCIEAAR